MADEKPNRAKRTGPVVLYALTHDGRRVPSLPLHREIGAQAGLPAVPKKK